MQTPSQPILDVDGLTVRFPVTGGVFLRRVGEVRAVDDVSFALGRGETLGLVGESGCGKTTVGRAIVNILRTMNYGVEVEGKILYHAASGPADLARLSRRAMRPHRADIQMVFQDPVRVAEPAPYGRAHPRGAVPDSWPRRRGVSPRLGRGAARAGRSAAERGRALPA